MASQGVKLKRRLLWGVLVGLAVTIRKTQCRASGLSNSRTRLLSRALPQFPDLSDSPAAPQHGKNRSAGGLRRSLQISQIETSAVSMPSKNEASAGQPSAPWVDGAGSLERLQPSQAARSVEKDASNKTELPAYVSSSKNTAGADLSNPELPLLIKPQLSLVSERGTSSVEQETPPTPAQRGEPEMQGVEQDKTPAALPFDGETVLVSDGSPHDQTSAMPPASATQTQTPTAWNATPQLLSLPLKLGNHQVLSALSGIEKEPFLRVSSVVPNRTVPGMQSLSMGPAAHQEKEHVTRKKDLSSTLSVLAALLAQQNSEASSRLTTTPSTKMKIPLASQGPDDSEPSSGPLRLPLEIPNTLEAQRTDPPKADVPVAARIQEEHGASSAKPDVLSRAHGNHSAQASGSKTELRIAKPQETSSNTNRSVEEPLQTVHDLRVGDFEGASALAESGNGQMLLPLSRTEVSHTESPKHRPEQHDEWFPSVQKKNPYAQFSTQRDIPSSSTVQPSSSSAVASEPGLDPTSNPRLQNNGFSEQPKPSAGENGTRVNGTPAFPGSEQQASFLAPASQPSAAQNPYGPDAEQSFTQLHPATAQNGEQGPWPGSSNYNNGARASRAPYGEAPEGGGPYPGYYYQSYAPQPQQFQFPRAGDFDARDNAAPHHARRSPSHAPAERHRNGFRDEFTELGPPSRGTHCGFRYPLRNVNALRNASVADLRCIFEKGVAPLRAPLGEFVLTIVRHNFDPFDVSSSGSVWNQSRFVMLTSCANGKYGTYATFSQPLSQGMTQATSLSKVYSRTGPEPPLHFPLATAEFIDRRPSLWFDHTKSFSETCSNYGTNRDYYYEEEEAEKSTRSRRSRRLVPTIRGRPNRAGARPGAGLKAFLDWTDKVLQPLQPTGGDTNNSSPESVGQRLGGGANVQQTLLGISRLFATMSERNDSLTENGGFRDVDRWSLTNDNIAPRGSNAQYLQRSGPNFPSQKQPRMNEPNSWYQLAPQKISLAYIFEEARIIGNNARQGQDILLGRVLSPVNGEYETALWWAATYTNSHQRG